MSTKYVNVNALCYTIRLLTILKTLKASTALLQHVRQEAKRLKELSTKKNLLDNDDDESDTEEQLAEDPPIWLNLTTKKHIVDKNRLKPGKISVPHSINSSPSLSICLITADPQRAVKDVVADPTFPASLSTRIGKVIGFSKLKAKYHAFESRRQLLAEHDIFLADDRIITRLVDTLGKIFYKDSAKRPIPIRIAKHEKIDGKRIKPVNNKKLPASDQSATVASPTIVAKEIQTALNAVPVSLRPGTNATVRVGRASFTPAQLSENITTVASALIDRYVARGWRNVKGIHIKSPNSAALPIWLADDLWVADDDVVKDGEEVELRKKKEAEVVAKRENRKKRKAEREEGHLRVDQHQQQQSKRQKSKETQKMEARMLDVARKAKLAQQKARVLEASA